MEEGREEEERTQGARKTCGSCVHLGFSFSCVEGYCTLRGKPVDEYARACADYRSAGCRAPGERGER